MNTCIYFGSFGALGLAVGYNKILMKSTTNTFPCEAGTLSLVHCAIVCEQSPNCTGVSFDRGNSSSCVSYTVGVPKQAYEPESGIFRSKSGQNCVEDLVKNIPDAQLTASSSWDYNHGPQRARLNTIEYGYSAGSWTAASHSPVEYIQARFNGIKDVRRIATQGRNGLPFELQCVTSYKVSYSIDCVTFAFLVDDENDPQIFLGNVDWDTIVWHDVEDSFLAVCVRVHPVTFITHPSLRFGLTGCDF